MRTTLWLLTATLLVPPPPAGAQTTVRLSLGAVQGTKLLGDRINPFDELYGINVVQAMGPAIQASIATPFGKNYRFRLEAQVNSTTLTVKNGDTGEQYEFGKLRTLSFLGMMEGEIVRDLEWQAGIGPIIYLPAERKGFFQDGGPVRWIVAIGLTRRIPLNSRLSLTASARYDFHQFMTKTLSDRGFSQYQAVHRGGLFLGLERTY